MPSITRRTMITQRERIKSILYACVVYVRRLLVGFVCVGRASRVEARRQRCMAKLVFTLVWLGRMFACAFMFCMRSWVRDCAPATLQARTHNTCVLFMHVGASAFRSSKVHELRWEIAQHMWCILPLTHTHTLSCWRLFRRSCSQRSTCNVQFQMTSKIPSYWNHSICSSLLYNLSEFAADTAHAKKTARI